MSEYVCLCALICLYFGYYVVSIEVFTLMEMYVCLKIPLSISCSDFCIFSVYFIFFAFRENLYTYESRQT